MGSLVQEDGKGFNPEIFRSFCNNTADFRNRIQKGPIDNPVALLTSATVEEAVISATVAISHPSSKGCRQSIYKAAHLTAVSSTNSRGSIA